MQPVQAVALLIAGVAASATAQAQSMCQAVYADSVRNVDVQSRILTEQNDIFNKHCESNGSMKQSSLGVDLTIPIKAIDVGFSGTSSEAQQRMQQFCKTNVERYSQFNSFYQLNNHVVIDALRSYNQCIALEGKRVQISHVATDTRSLVVKVGFNPAEQTVTLNSVQYDTGVATCTSNIAGDGSPKELSPTTGQITASRPFSVACERKAAGTATGELKFPRFELLVDTNQGAYTVAMPTEGMLGYDLANASQMNLLAATQEQQRLSSENATLRAKMAKPIAKPMWVVQGQGATVPCSQNGGDVSTYVKNSCNGIVSEFRQVSSVGGRRCGYTRYEWSCVTYP